MKRVGVFGGTFDPIHLGHLVCADQLREAFGLDQVIFLPCNRSPHKPRYRPAPVRHRIRMAELAVGDCRAFTVSDLEARRGGLSYTVDTVVELRRRLGPRVELWLLLGMDAYHEVRAWKKWEQVVQECFLGVARRPGYARAGLGGAVAAKTRFAQTAEINISSSDVRRRVRSGKSVAFLVPARVEAYVRRHRLYGARPRRLTGAGRCAKLDRFAPRQPVRGLRRANG
ncbi:MAG: nicotinate-nucleotide adenylyltransferase [bacterium]